MEKIDKYKLSISLFSHLKDQQEKEIISLLEKHPFLVSQPLSTYGATVFHFAVRFGNHQVLDYLIHQQQIDIHQVDKDRENAMFYALDITENDNGKMIQKLYDLGVSIHGINRDGYSLLMMSVLNIKLKSVEFLIEHGADVNYESSDGNSLLSLLESHLCQSKLPLFIKHLDKFTEKNKKRLKKLRLKQLVERGITHE